MKGGGTGASGGENRLFVAFFPNVRAKGDKDDRDARIARIAAKQYGVISAGQLRSAGFSTSGIDRAIRAARLFAVHRGVYAVGHVRLSDAGRWLAAVLACGEGAVLSHTSAAELWGIRRPLRRPSTTEPPAVHVSVPGTSGRRQRRGIILHRSTTLIAGVCTRRDGIPVTNPTRTLADLQSVTTSAQLAAARREAEFLQLPINEPLDADRARTGLEQLFLSLCRRHRLPQPDVNARVDRYEVDFFWPDARLIAEGDGWESHRTRSAFEEDRARDARLMVLGYRVVRFTWRQAERDGAAVARTIRALLKTR